uniref:Uncharacterized protein n=1 Tax=viral metagenome TaxID=1070528 RepID=A0A6C0LPQ3_9ZZZZ
MIVSNEGFKRITKHESCFKICILCLLCTVYVFCLILKSVLFIFYLKINN